VRKRSILFTHWPVARFLSSILYAEQAGFSMPELSFNPTWQAPATFVGAIVPKPPAIQH
tara:strand:- start:383 stop:559 length:177 start_codon:yes stop_codon:yes gene_type:complete